MITAKNPGLNERSARVLSRNIHSNFILSGLLCLLVVQFSGCGLNEYTYSFKYKVNVTNNTSSDCISVSLVQLNDAPRRGEQIQHTTTKIDKGENALLELYGERESEKTLFLLIAVDAAQSSLSVEKNILKFMRNEDYIVGSMRNYGKYAETMKIELTDDDWIDSNTKLSVQEQFTGSTDPEK